ncbi:uncharacterized protein At4g08330, chloroplastic-like [Neltuma alba]|uniref:uncharacterized protein At4g08330, chloroplastic-like n=1 Tax=Neltuma alba TaxID=207710 RepID=UPI0010A43870|nr:uncharacterized protein At4g08330, chloroplastic-like [Prosopis alba]XP_028786462.1 uncharacterized protein At4g08330, chloroplastic-like [Prosopis alba]
MIASGDMLEGCQGLHLSSYIRDVNYSCGSCGYQLNLNSCNRNTSAIDTRYEKSIKRGLISFFSVDESRFSMVEQLRWVPFFNSKRSWGLFQRRTKLLCRKCGNHIGYACSLPFESWDGFSDSRVYDIKLSALQPSFYQDPGTFTSSDSKTER